MERVEKTLQEPALAQAEVGDVMYLTATAGPSDPAAAYERLAEALSVRRAVAVQERVFGSLSAREEILSARQDELGRVVDPTRWPVTFVQGNPAGGVAGLAGVHMIAVRGDEPERVVDGERVAGAIVRRAGSRRVFLGNLRARVAYPDPVAQAEEMYSEARRLLDLAGTDFTRVPRTWIYLSDILTWYDAFNVVRTRNFRELGLIRDACDSNVPASTGIEGTSPDGFLCAMDLIAVDGPGVTVRPLDSPRQCGATDYGSMFARATLVSETAGETMYVSGTAAIDGAGRTVLVGDLEGQTRHTLATVEALLGQAGLGLRDLTLATAFIKRGGDVEVVRRVFGEVAPQLLEMPLVEADVCREDLLFELDGMAVRPR